MFTKQPLRTRQSRRSTMPVAGITSKVQVQDKKSNESCSPSRTTKANASSLYEQEKRSITKSCSRRGTMPSTTTASSRQLSLLASTSKQHESHSSLSSSIANIIRPTTYWGMNDSMYGQLNDSEKELLDFHNLNIDSSNTMDCSYSSMEQSSSSIVEQCYSRTHHDSSILGGKRQPTTNQSFREAGMLRANTPIRPQSNSGYLEEKIRYKSMWETNTKSQAYGNNNIVVQSNEMLKESSHKVSSPYRHHSEISFVPPNDELSIDSGSFDFNSSAQLRNSRKSDLPSIVVVPIQDDTIHVPSSMHNQHHQQLHQQQRYQHQPESQRVYQQVQQQQQQQHHIELLPGYCLPLLGAQQTQEAIRSKDICACYCFSCTVPLCCCTDAEYVLCPDCYVVSPIESFGRRTTGRNNIGQGSVGFGVKTIHLSQSQRQILDQ